MIENGERVFSGADVGTDDILVSLPGALVPRGTIVGLQPIKSSINGDLLKEALQKLLNGFFPLRVGGVPPNSAQFFWAE